MRRVMMDMVSLTLHLIIKETPLLSLLMYLIHKAECYLKKIPINKGENKKRMHFDLI
jgi:hypothetical protein